MCVYYRLWFKDRETKKRSQIIKAEFWVDDILMRAHDLLLSESDHEFECYRVDLVEISDFTL